MWELSGLTSLRSLSLMALRHKVRTATKLCFVVYMVIHEQVRNAIYTTNATSRWHLSALLCAELLIRLELTGAHAPVGLYLQSSQTLL